MKLVVAVVQSEDASGLLTQLSNRGFRATRIKTAGGFLREANATIFVGVEAEDVDTLGGYVYSQLGKMPVSGDSFDVDNVSFSVVSTVGRRIKKVRVVKNPPGAENGQADLDSAE